MLVECQTQGKLVFLFSSRICTFQPVNNLYSSIMKASLVGFVSRNAVWRNVICYSGVRGSSIGIVTGLGLDDQGLVPAGGLGIFFFSIASKLWLWGPPGLLFNGYLGLFPLGWSCWGMKLTTHLLVPWWRLHGTIPPSPVCLHGMMHS